MAGAISSDGRAVCYYCRGMTVAIAAKFPWGEWRKVGDSLPLGHWERVVILAADTRWSYTDREPEDRGLKLWTLGRQVGLVLARG